MAAFFVENDSIVWASDPVETVFPMADGDEDQGFSASVASASSGADDGETPLLECPVDADESRFYWREQHALGDETTSLRLDLFRDVTAAVDCRERLSLFEQLTERARDGLYATDADGTIEYCNQSFAKLLGFEQAALVGQASSDFVAGEDHQQHAAAVERVESGEADGSEILDVSYLGRDGETSQMEVHLSPREQDGGHIAVVRDVTERNERERRLEQYRQLVESAGDPMYAIDEEGTIELANSAMRDLFEADQLVGRDVRTVLDEDSIERGEAAIRHLLRNDDQEWVTLELTEEDEDGQERLFEVTIGIRTDADGTFRGSVATLRDVTERERQQRDIDLLRRTLGSVARAGVQDELATIERLADTLVETLDEECQPIAADIRAVAQRLGTLPEKIEEIERLVDTDPEVVTHSLSSVLADSIAAVEDANPAATIDVDVPPGTRVSAIPTVGLAVQNLVENALVHAGTAPTVSVSASVEESTVAVTVADDGPGIPREELTVLNRAAETPLEHGSGIGLWLVEWVVRKSGGIIDYETSMDGTRITLRLNRPQTDSPLTGESTGSDTVDEGTAVDTDDEDIITAVYVDEVESARTAVRERAAATDSAVEVRTVAGVDAATDHLATADCLIAEHLPPDKFQTLSDAAEDHGTALVLYTEADHSDVAEVTLDAIDTLVQKGVDQSRIEFLLEKVQAIAGDRTHDDTWGTTPPAEDVQAACAEWVVAVDGTIAVTGTPEAEATNLLDAGREAAPDDGPADTPLGGDSPTISQYRYCRWEPDGVYVSRIEIVVPSEGTLTRRERKNLLEGLVEQTRDGISVVDANGQISYHNEAFSDILGYDDMVGEYAASFMAEGELQTGQLAVQRLMASPSLESEVHDIDMVRADGASVTVADHFAVRYVDGEYGGLINVARDVTERKERERRLEQYRQLVESAGDPMYVLDEEGTIEVLNAAMAEFVGHEQDELVGTNVTDISTEEQLARGREAIRTVLADPDTDWTTYERTFTAGDGTERRFEVTVGVLLDDGHFAGSVSTFHDITDRVRQTEELTLLKQVLARILRHNLRNEMTVISGKADILRERAAGEAAETAGAIADHCETLLEIADNARTVEKTIQTDQGTETHDIETLVAEGHPAVDHREGCPTGRVSGRAELPRALYLLGEVGAESEGRVALTVERTPAAIDFEYEMDRSLPAIPAEVTSVDFTDRTAVQLWLVDWVVTESGGQLSVDGMTVTVSLQTDRQLASKYQHNRNNYGHTTR